MMGFPVVLLTTKGAKSGQERTVSIAGFGEGDETWLVIASAGGSHRHPAWFNNMVKHPDDIWLEVGSRKMKVTGESLHGREREETLAPHRRRNPSIRRLPEKDGSRDPDRPPDPRFGLVRCARPADPPTRFA